MKEAQQIEDSARIVQNPLQRRGKRGMIQLGTQGGEEQNQTTSEFVTDSSMRNYEYSVSSDKNEHTKAQ